MYLEYPRGDADHVPRPAPRVVPLLPGLSVVEGEREARLPPELLHRQLEAVHHEVVAARVVLHRAGLGIVISGVV